MCRKSSIQHVHPLEEPQGLADSSTNSRTSWQKVVVERERGGEGWMDGWSNGRPGHERGALLLGFLKK